MKTGIIIVFHNYEKNIDQDFFIKYLKKIRPIKFCLVNNNSKDKTGLLLSEITEECKNVSLVNIKRFRSEKSAVRAGVRYLWNEFGIEQIGYVNTQNFNDASDYKTLIRELLSKEDYVVSYQSMVYEARNTKRTLFQSLFSLKEYLDNYNRYNNNLNLL